VLNLSHNKIGTRGATLLCEALKDHAKLESLFLDDNSLDTDAAQPIARLLGAGGNTENPMMGLNSNL
jgi:Ran GTPase-activating protein (RanGAP) involved in mRNA processing and transport